VKINEPGYRKWRNIEIGKPINFNIFYIVRYQNEITLLELHQFEALTEEQIIYNIEKYKIREHEKDLHFYLNEIKKFSASSLYKLIYE
jgi:hypothetical protein